MNKGAGFTYTDFSRGEAAFGLFWLALAAVLSAFLSVVYLGAWASIGPFRFPFPYPIVLALLFNLVLTRTAKLWTNRKLVAAIPVIAWCVTFLVLTFWVTVTGDQLVGPNLRSILLLIAGIAGGSWPLLDAK